MCKDLTTTIFIICNDDDAYWIYDEQINRFFILLLLLYDQFQACNFELVDKIVVY